MITELSIHCHHAVVEVFSVEVCECVRKEGMEVKNTDRDGDVNGDYYRQRNRDSNTN